MKTTRLFFSGNLKLQKHNAAALRSGNDATWELKTVKIEINLRNAISQQVCGAVRVVVTGNSNDLIPAFSRREKETYWKRKELTTEELEPDAGCRMPDAKNCRRPREFPQLPHCYFYFR